LVEPQRTNLALYSEQFDNAAWIKTNTSVTANNTTSPDGTTNADKLSATISTIVNPAEMLQATSQSGSTTYSYSVYAKKSTSNFIALRHTGVSGNPYAWFNLNTGTIGTVESGITAKIESVGNGWYRCIVTGTTAAVVGVNRVDMIVSDNDGNYICAINGSIFIWGAQLEAGSYPTSYIPTTSAAVTRNADVISKTGISALIGQTEGAVFVDVNVDLSYTQNDMRFINVSDGTSTNWWFIGTNVSNQIRFYYRTSATTYVSELVPLTSGRHKLAFAYKSNDYVAYVDGTQIYSLNSLIVGATSQIDLGNSFGGSGVSKQFINSAILFPTRLTNAELASLTTL
jgi:hypothetical protein